jgi:hypothetical protein
MTRAPSVLQWTPRIAGIGVSLFLALFALDAFNGRTFFEALPGFVIHLAPAAVVLALVAIAWRLPWVGAVVFPLLAVVYGVMVRWRLDWFAAIGGPLVVLGVLFFVAWRANEHRA